MTNRHTTLGQIEARLAREDLLAGATRLSDGHAAREVWDVTADSRLVRVGAVFCAWRGTSSDSHRYLPQVFERGASGAVVEECEVEIPTPQLCVTDGRLGAAYAAAEFFSDPWEWMTLVGVTGTNGKTTTSYLTSAMFEAAGVPCGLMGTVTYRIGGILVRPPLQRLPKLPDRGRKGRKAGGERSNDEETVVPVPQVRLLVYQQRPSLLRTEDGKHAG